MYKISRSLLLPQKMRWIAIIFRFFFIFSFIPFIICWLYTLGCCVQIFPPVISCNYCCCRSCRRQWLSARGKKEEEKEDGRKMQKTRLMRLTCFDLPLEQQQSCWVLLFLLLGMMFLLLQHKKVWEFLFFLVIQSKMVKIKRSVYSSSF